MTPFEITKMVNLVDVKYTHDCWRNLNKNMKKKRDNKNGKYYCISNPTEVNIHTGNYCVSYKDYIKNDKDYLFDWIDPSTGTHYEKVIDRDYLHAHCKPCPKWMWDEISLKNELKGMFYLISFKDIYLYE